MKVEDEVELAHVPEILVQHLDKEMDKLQHTQLVRIHIHTQRKI